MVKKKSETQVVEVVEDILCNKCGDSCMKAFDIADSSIRGDFYGTTIGYQPGYSSTHFSDDNCTHRADICEKCIFEFFSSFKIPAEVF